MTDVVYKFLDTDSKRVHKILRTLFIRLAQQNNITWSDDTLKAKVPYCRLYNHSGVAVASAIYVDVTLPNGMVSKAYQYEIHNSIESVYKTVTDNIKFIREFAERCRTLVIPYLNRKDPPRKSAGSTTPIVSSPPSLYYKVVTFKDISDKPIDYVDPDDAMKHCSDYYTASINRYYDCDWD